MQMLDVHYSNVTSYLHSPGCVQPLSRGRGRLCCRAPPPELPPGHQPLVWAASEWCQAPRILTSVLLLHLHHPVLLAGLPLAAETVGDSLEERFVRYLVS